MKTQLAKRNLTSLFLALVIAFSTLPVTFAAQGTLAGEGTQDSPYLIEDAADLKAFRDMVNKEASSAVYALLTADIDLNNEEWTPIYPESGYITEAYAGTFDGDGHTISGLSINASSTYQGLFGGVNGATIQNLKVEGHVSSSKAYVGGIVGKVQQGTIENCSFSGSVTTAVTTSSGHVGGIVGYAGNTATQTASISGCTSAANVTGGVAGGIVGYAKFTTISNCYNTGTINGTSRSGGIAGQLQNNCTASNCYNIGTISGSGTAADICDFLYSSATLTKCYYQTQASGAGTGTTTDCGEITSADALLEALGSAYAADANQINNGYPVLAWQAGAAPVPKDPHIVISGNATLNMTNNGTTPSTTLTVQYIDMDDTPAVEWSVKDNSDIINLETPDNADESNHIIIVNAVKPGKATVIAATADNTYTAECEISVIPFITTVELEGTAAVGQTVYAHVNVLGGGEYDYENYPALTFQWKYLTADDYSSGNTGSSSYQDIAGATNRAFSITEELTGQYLSFSLWFDGEYKTPSRPIKVISAAAGVLSADKLALDIDTADIRENKTLVLPVSGAAGSVIQWTSSDSQVINPENGTVILPESGISEIKLTATLSYGGETDTKEFTVKVYSQAAIDEENANKLLQLEKAVASLGDYYKMYPVCGTDTNVIDMLKQDLAESGYADIGISIQSVEEVYGGAGIADDGTITYFYADPNSTPVIRMGSYQVTFRLTYEDAEKDLEVPVILYWDIEKVQAVMRAEILDNVTDASLTEEDATAVTGNLTLPKVVDDKKWTLISWSSSNENAISISSENQQTADTLFEPYVGVVKQGADDEQVTLTATFTFMLTNDVTGNEAPITLSKVYPITVKALDEEQSAAIRNQLEEKLNAGFEAAGLTDAVTGELLAADDTKYTAYNDIQFPTTRDFGVDGKYYPVTISSSDETVIAAPDVNNAARVTVYRPAVGKPDAEATITVSISDKDTNITASKTFTIKVPALTQEEVDSEIALMEKVKAAYFDGIKGQNTDPGNISQNLASFQEVYEEDGELVWVRDSKDIVNHGIVPVAMDGWEELEAWRLFKSSNPAAVTHENLIVSIQKNAKAVTISSALSSETLGKYGQLYKEDPVKYADYATLADLYYQEVSADLVIRGTTTLATARPVAVIETIDVSFRLQSSDSTLISKTSYTDLDETTTVYDIFKQALRENDYTYKNRGSYVYSITTPDGTTLEELDEGENSGWMYKVNGKIPNVYMGAYGLKDGDEIVVFFTKDYTEETGYSRGSGGGSSSSVKNDSNTEEQTNDNTDDENTGNENIAYTDISGHWAESAIRYASEAGWINGIGESRFDPEGSLTRAMFVTVLYRMENEPEAETSPFTDIESGSWYEKAVAWASANGIVKGISETEFAPDSAITREQMAVIVYRYAALKGYDLTGADTASYADTGTISDYAMEAVLWADEKAIMLGNADGTFAPQDSTTRAQAAAVFMRVAENLQ